MSKIDDHTRKILEGIKNLPALPADNSSGPGDEEREKSFYNKIAQLENYTKEGKTVIAIDAGHGWAVEANKGKTKGSHDKPVWLKGTFARNDAGIIVNESDLTVVYAKRAKELLEEKGYKVILTAGTKDDPLKDDFNSRIQPAKDNEAAIFISIHFDYNPSSKLSGPSVYIAQKRPGVGDEYNQSDQNKLPRELAESISSSMGGVRVLEANKAVTLYEHTGTYKGAVHSPKTTAALVEMGFFSNAQEFVNLQKPSYRDELLTKLVDGIDKHVIAQKEKYNQVLAEYLGIGGHSTIASDIKPIKTKYGANSYDQYKPSIVIPEFKPEQSPSNSITIK